MKKMPKKEEKIMERIWLTKEQAKKIWPDDDDTSPYINYEMLVDDYKQQARDYKELMLEYKKLYEDTSKTLYIQTGIKK